MDDKIVINRNGSNEYEEGSLVLVSVRCDVARYG